MIRQKYTWNRKNTQSNSCASSNFLVNVSRSSWKIIQSSTTVQIQKTFRETSFEEDSSPSDQLFWVNERLSKIFIFYFLRKSFIGLQKVNHRRKPLNKKEEAQIAWWGHWSEKCLRTLFRPERRFYFRTKNFFWSSSIVRSRASNCASSFNLESAKIARRSAALLPLLFAVYYCTSQPKICQIFSYTYIIV